MLYRYLLQQHHRPPLMANAPSAVQQVSSLHFIHDLLQGYLGICLYEVLKSPCSFFGLRSKTCTASAELRCLYPFHPLQFHPWLPFVSATQPFSNFRMLATSKLFCLPGACVLCAYILTVRNTTPSRIRDLTAVFIIPFRSPAHTLFIAARVMARYIAPVSIVQVSLSASFLAIGFP